MDHRLACDTQTPLFWESEPPLTFAHIPLPNSSRAALQGVRFLAGLRSIRANTIREVRGRGLMLAIELHPEAGGARRYCEALQSRGILAKDTHEHMIRIAPPLVITADQVEWALEGIEAILRQDFP